MRFRHSAPIPGIHALIAFEAAARFGSLSRAAKELHTSQPVLSRHIGKLEAELSAQLFERTSTGVRLTDTGSRYHDAVARSLDILQAAGAEVRSREQQVVIAGTNETSHLFVMPRYEALHEALGEHVRIRIVNDYRPNTLNPRHDPVADVVLTWDAASLTSQDRVVALMEALRPLCSPGYAATYADVLEGPVSGWTGLSFLDLTLPQRGFGAWKDWFEAAGCPDASPRYLGFNSYAYVLEAATARQGIALGWRGFIERYLDNGSLVPLGDGFVETGNTYYCVLTENGRANPLARKCLEFFDHSVGGNGRTAGPSGRPGRRDGRE
ncbi:MAG: LysR family transcriptional regulator [Deltaproteobacteria bacterium]|nr:LysR family transcriptional regulator [Deltaproteobacteria bacterium]